MDVANCTHFSDAEELSQALSHTNVRAVQTSRVDFQAKLAHVRAVDWSVQYISFMQGAAACDGDGPSDSFAFIIPLISQQSCRLLGRPLTSTSIGVYAPGSEHADTSAAGHEQVVLVPPTSLFADERGNELALDLPRNGSHHLSASTGGLDVLRSVMWRVLANSGVFAPANATSEIQRSLNDELSVVLAAALPSREARNDKGRPSLPRAAVMRHVAEILDAERGEPVYAGELAKAVGVSDATLRRMFIELFGMPPARYLMIKRLYLARQRLRSGAYETVGQVAEACGFWDLGRFAGRYKSVFNELPYETLRSARK